MSTFEIFVSVIAAVTLFVYGLKGFSRDIQEVGGEGLKIWMSQVTQSAPKAFFLGAIMTALVQSSSAVTGLAVAFVEAEAMSFRGSLPVFLGANVGTTSTAWLVSLKLTNLGSYLIALSVLISLVPRRVSLFAQSFFYLGVVLLSLDMISYFVSPIKNDPNAIHLLTYAKYSLIGVVIGIIGTALVQSSSVMIGLSIIAVQQNLLGSADVIPIIIGSNLGTTSTALIAAKSMGITAKRAAWANFIFNLSGVLIFLTFLKSFSSWVIDFTPEGGQTVAVAHLVFNVVVSVFGFLISKPVASFLEKKIND